VLKVRRVIKVRPGLPVLKARKVPKAQPEQLGQPALKAQQVQRDRPQRAVGPEGPAGDPLDLDDGTFPRSKLDDSTESALKLAEASLQQVPDGYTQQVREEIAEVRNRLSHYANRNDPRFRDPREPLKGTVTLDHLAPEGW
jgi:hypothetical protein